MKQKKKQRKEREMLRAGKQINPQDESRAEKLKRFGREIQMEKAKGEEK